MELVNVFFLGEESVSLVGSGGGWYGEKGE